MVDLGVVFGVGVVKLGLGQYPPFLLGLVEDSMTRRIVHSLFPRFLRPVCLSSPSWPVGVAPLSPDHRLPDGSAPTALARAPAG